MSKLFLGILLGFTSVAMASAPEVVGTGNYYCGFTGPCVDKDYEAAEQNAKADAINKCKGSVKQVSAFQLEERTSGKPNWGGVDTFAFATAKFQCI